MKAFPYFIPNALLFLLAMLAIPLAIAFPAIWNYLLLILSAGIFLLFFKTYEVHAGEFGRAVGRIKDLSWESVFLSEGVLRLRFRGEPILYSSSAGQDGDLITVDYSLSLENRSGPAFIALNSGDGFSVEGDRDAFGRIAGDVSAFDRSYHISRIVKSGGRLEIAVRLFFDKHPLRGQKEKEEKLADMAGFLGDYLDFSCRINTILKSPAAGKTTAVPGKRQRKH
ncbi:MAG: hypothetical protein U0R44_01040 [Candidatus Micrarchaeia archaeon]